METILNKKTCATIALSLYKYYEKEMEPPVFAVIPFKDWLERIVETEPKDNERGMSVYDE